MKALRGPMPVEAAPNITETGLSDTKSADQNPYMDAVTLDCPAPQRTYARLTPSPVFCQRAQG